MKNDEENAAGRGQELMARDLTGASPGSDLCVHELLRVLLREVAMGIWTGQAIGW